jgi:hypothetical protein
MESFWKYFLALFMIGFVNNFSYVLISVGSQAIADHFNQSNLMPLFQIMLVLFSIPMLVVNFTYLSKVNTLLRITATCVSMLLCFVVMSICLSTDSE